MFQPNTSVDRLRAARRRRARVAMTILWALVFSLFVSVGNAGGMQAPDPDVTVCRDGETKVIKTSQVKDSDALGPCAEEEPVIVATNPNTDAAACAAVGGHLNGNSCKVTICHRGNAGGTQEVDYNGVQASDTRPPNCAPEAPTTVTCGQYTTAPGVHTLPYTCVNQTVTCGEYTTAPGSHDLPYTCVNQTVNCGQYTTSPGVHDLPYTCVNRTVTCGIFTTSPGSHDLPYTCVNATVTCNASSTTPGTFDMPYTCMPKIDVCIPFCGGIPPEILCMITGGTWNGTTCVYVTTVTCGDEYANPGTWPLGTQCIPKSPEQVDCELGDGSWDGECYFDGKVTMCHQLGNGGYKLLDVALAAQAAHLEHGDKLPFQGSCDPTVEICDQGEKRTVFVSASEGFARPTDGSCPQDTCPDALNEGFQSGDAVCNVAAVVDACIDEALNPGVQAAGPCNVAAAAGGPDAAAAAPMNDWVDPAVDVDRTGPLANGAAAPPQDGTDGPETVMAAAAGPAATPAADDGTLPLTGMSPIGTIIAALLAVLFGGVAYGEARRASRRTAHASA